jgi:hypothetical protein
MYVIFDSADGDRVHPVILGDPGHIRPQLWPEVVADQLQTACCAEDDVDVVAHVGHLCRPFGTYIVNLTVTGTAAPGYRLFLPFGPVQNEPIFSGSPGVRL